MDGRLGSAVVVTAAMSIIIIFVASQLEGAFPVVVGLVLVMAALQMTILLGGQRSVLIRARQYFIQGDFEAAAELLEAMETESPRAVVLLGNTYRLLNRLEASEAALRRVLEMRPSDKMALYGLGRTLLVRGHYADAARYIETALANGARRTVMADLALALYYAEAESGRILELAQRALRVLQLEAYRILLAAYLVYNLDDQQRTAAHRLMVTNAVGLNYWQAEVQRYHNRDYGQRLATDVMEIKAIVEEQVTNE